MGRVGAPWGFQELAGCSTAHALDLVLTRRTGGGVQSRYGETGDDACEPYEGCGNGYGIQG